MTTGVHRAAATGFADGADIYAASRPAYPAAALDWLRDRLAIEPNSRVVEVGAGTGLFTRLLLDTGAAVVATDPVPEMLAHLASTLPGVDTTVATAEALPIADGSIDAVICATAFHWFATPQALAEFRRVLKPGGFAVIGCPDLQSMAELIVQDKLHEPAYQSPAGGITPHDTLYGFGAQLARGYLYMAHRCGFTRSSLMKTLLTAGFGRVGVRRGRFELWAVATNGHPPDGEVQRLMQEYLPS